ncbi:tyrosine-type recombinase/integrase [Gimibacter soli]|uniref:Tyrosine-type recombinase/integrase n=1 Tax=Gimibacter soli TaxID=3024400 RepID=A0AAE9XSS5_9PROT|nr:tyrosine-type recombinase/integrase [Gimibacter soli]WCL55609.1 tyrosine-type recombinase/integrase [Gimibacter soli]
MARPTDPIPRPALAATDAAARLLGWLPVREALQRDLDAVYDRAAALARMAHADHTRRAYKTAWTQYEAWCRGVGVAPLSGDPGTVALYLATLSLKVRPTTLQARLAAISVAHRLAGVRLDTRHEAIRLVMRGAAREKGLAPARQATPVSLDDLRRLGRLFGPSRIERRDRAVLFLGFAAALRRAEITALTLADISFTPDGLTVTIRQGKGDPAGRGAKVPVSRHPDPAVCPVRALKAWLAERGDRAGPLFCQIHRSGSHRYQPLAPRAAGRIVKAAVQRLGQDPTTYSGHSLRAGLASAAADAGIGLHSLMEQTRLKSAAQAVTYMRGRGRRTLTRHLFGLPSPARDDRPDRSDCSA